MSDDRPPPGGDVLAAAWWAGVAAGELRFQRCGACGAAVFYPRPRCPRCFAAALEWAVSEGLGTVAAVTVVRRAPAPAFADLVPYAVALVDLDEGFRMLGNVVDLPADEVRVGQRVRVVFRPGPEGDVLPHFVPAA